MERRDLLARIGIQHRQAVRPWDLLRIDQMHNGGNRRRAVLAAAIGDCPMSIFLAIRQQALPGEIKTILECQALILKHTDSVLHMLSSVALARGVPPSAGGVLLAWLKGRCF